MGWSSSRSPCRRPNSPRRAARSPIRRSRRSRAPSATYAHFIWRNGRPRGQARPSPERRVSSSGAHAIAALAYGTESLPKVEKIFGPGNVWVTTAKQLVAQDPGGAACDLPAGPSEIMVIADESARADFVAADLLAQAEHDPLAQ